MGAAQDAGRFLDRRGPDGNRARRSRFELLRELRLRVAAQLRALLRRGDRETHRSAVAGARSDEAPGPRAGDPAPIGRGGDPAGPRLASRLLRAVAPCEEPGAAPLALRLGTDAGRLARQ